MQELILFFCCLISALILCVVHLFFKLRESTEAVNWLFEMLMTGTQEQILKERKALFGIQKEIAKV